MSETARKEVSLSISDISKLQPMADAAGMKFGPYLAKVITEWTSEYSKTPPKTAPAKEIVKKEKPAPESKCGKVRKEIGVSDENAKMLNEMAKAAGTCFRTYTSDLITAWVNARTAPSQIQPIIVTKVKPRPKQVVTTQRKELLLKLSSIAKLSEMAASQGVCLRVLMERILTEYTGVSIATATDRKAERKAKSRRAASGSNKSSPNHRQNDRIQTLAESIARRYDPSIDVMRSNMAELVSLISPKLKYHIWKMLNHRANSDEVLSNTLEKIVSKFNTYDPFFRFTTWAFRIAINEAKLFKTKKKAVLPNYDIAETITTLDTSDDNIEGKKNFENLYSLAISCIHSYPDCVDKSIFIDKDINRMQLKDLAVKYDLNENTVKTKLKSMRAKIRKSIVAADADACHKYETFKNISHELI